MEKISWKTTEYLHNEKTTDWYWIVGIITISIALISIILNNLIFAILIIISSFTLTLFASKKPEIMSVEFSDKEFTFGEKKHKYSEIDAFWIELRDGTPRIILKSKKVFMPYISIFLENTEPDKLKEFLSPKLQEEEMSEPLFEKLLIYFGF